MDRRLSIGVLAAALLLSGLFVGVSYGGPSDLGAPQTIVLYEGDILGQAGRHTKVQLEDGDGQVVGSIVWGCSNTAVSWTCTNVLVVKPGSSIPTGTIVISGIFRGFNGERLAVVGGTGAYRNVGGVDTLSVTDDGFTHTLSLVP
ncbi:MAG TPA: hypothetical protein VF235_00950 [Actinomycetota bacterium]